jgi:uncharacterized protein with HEPN domain
LGAGISRVYLPLTHNGGEQPWGKIETITAATSEEVFLGDEVLPEAVLHHLTVMGEAISRLSRELRERLPEVPWHQIVAVRHRIVHAYFDLDWQSL